MHRGPTPVVMTAWWTHRAFRRRLRNICFEEIKMAKEELIEMQGSVTEVLPDSRFPVTLDNRHQLIAYTGGKMRNRHIRIEAGDKVALEMSPYALSKAPITFRHLAGRGPGPSSSR